MPIFTTPATDTKHAPEKVVCIVAFYIWAEFRVSTQRNGGGFSPTRKIGRSYLTEGSTKILCTPQEKMRVAASFNLSVPRIESRDSCFRWHNETPLKLAHADALVLSSPSKWVCVMRYDCDLIRDRERNLFQEQSSASSWNQRIYFFG